MQQRPGNENLRLALILAAPISVLSGLLGVGPGFLLMPTLILVGFETKHAAGINAFAVTLPSFSALIPHLSTAVWYASLTVALLIAGAVGSFAGARTTSLYVPGARLKPGFALLIVAASAYKVVASRSAARFDISSCHWIICGPPPLPSPPIGVAAEAASCWPSSRNVIMSPFPFTCTGPRGRHLYVSRSSS